MNGCNLILPGIKAIFFTQCSSLQEGIELSAISGNDIAVLADLTKINFLDVPQCLKSKEKQNGGFVDTVTLSFKSSEDLPADCPLAFVVTDVNDVSWLIGCKEKPWPVVKSQYSSGSVNGEPAGYKIEITHKSVRSFLRCRK